ncbi:MAG: hypothetical protein KF832_03050 [Caldilineaceae bacterium]|nr:hypothetical protein [Caldilineaceae bacterium]
MGRSYSRILIYLLVCALCYTPMADLQANSPIIRVAYAQSATATPTPTPTPIPTPSSLTTDPLAQLITKLPTLKRLVERIQRQLDRSQVDLDDLALSLGGDGDALVEWVRTNIAFEQYPGLLRGTRGTLIGRAGNALDTAFLLAHLLADAGYEVRIARGSLSPTVARTLIDQMLAPRAAAAPTGDEAALIALLVELGETLGLSASASRAQVEAALAPDLTEDVGFVAAQEDTAFILDALDDAGIVLGDEAAVDDLVTEAEDYFWVQYRLSVGQPWQAAHPAFKDPAAAPTQLKASTTFLDEVPPELLHRIRIQVSIEQKVDDELATAVIMPAWESPVAALVGQPLIYRNNPVSLENLEQLLDVESFLAKPVTFVPSFNNELVLNGLGFDLNGATYDVGLLGGDTLAVTQMGQTIGNILEEATGALDGAEPEPGATPEAASDLITLTGQWIDYTLIAPGGVERTFRRTILDRIGAENRAAGLVKIAVGEELPAAATTLLTQHTILVLPSTYSQAYVAQRFLSQLKSAIDLVDYLQKQRPFTDALVAPPLPLLMAASSFDDVLLNTLFARNPPADANLISYRPEPYLVVLEDGLLLNRTQPTGFLRVDVINNTRRTFTTTGGELQVDATTNVLAGAWETRAEQSPFAHVQGQRFSTFTAFLAAAEAGVPTQVITAPDPALLADLALPAMAQQAIARDLENGYIVLVPEAIASGDGAAGWWRVNPRTGETLGLAGDGRGTDTVEYSFLLALKENLILGAPSTMAGFAICMAGASGSAGCCAADAAAAYGAGAVLGALVAARSASAAILLGEALKFGGIMGGAAGATPSFCNL